MYSDITKVLKTTQQQLTNSKCCSTQLNNAVSLAVLVLNGALQL